MFVVVRAALLFSFLLSWSITSAETPEELAKLPVKKLRQFLAARGLECKACTEKEEFVKLAVANIDTPVKEQPASTPPPPPGDEDPVKRDKDISDLMENMKKSGLGNFKFYSPNDLKNMNPDDMVKNMGGDTKYSKKFNKDKAQGGRPKSGRKEKRQAQERFRRDAGREDAEGERIEL